MSVIKTGPAQLWIKGAEGNWEYIGTTEGSLNWMEKEMPGTETAFKIGDRVRLKDSPHEGNVTSSWSLVYFRTDADVMISVSNPDLLELVRPTAQVGDIWRDENGGEWVIRRGSSGLIVTNVDVRACTEYFECARNDSARTLDKWYKNYKPTLVRRRGE
jgi:hypothetical protein